MDKTEDVRRMKVAAINADPKERKGLEETYGKVWNTNELTKEFDVEGFMAPFAVVKNKKTGTMGSVCFQDRPRFYFEFIPA